MTLRKIISGGQTGADQGGLRAGRALGLETGGWAPPGWRTLDGPAPWLADYGLVESTQSGVGNYAARTRLNVRDSDATVRFARDFHSPGERCTLRAIDKHAKPHLNVTEWDLLAPPEFGTYKFRVFIQQFDVGVLNVAGNSEQRAPGIAAAVERFLVFALRAGVR